MAEHTVGSAGVQTRTGDGAPRALFGTTFNYGERQSDYTGAWNGFALYAQ